MKIECKKKEYLLNTKWLKVRQDCLLIDEEKVVNDYFVTENPDVVLVVALTGKHDVILKTEYRYPIDQMLTEIPGGMINPETETPLDAIKRELKEETGYESDEWELLAKTYNIPPRDTSSIFLYLAKNCVLMSGQNLDEFEELSFSLIPLREAVNMVLTNKICVNSSANALLRCAALYPELLG